MTMLNMKTTRMILVLAAVMLMALSATSAFGQGKPATIDVIIGFNSSPGASGEALIDGVGGTVNGRFSLIPAISATIPISAINGLEANPNVAYVEEDGFKDLHTDSAVGELQWGTNRIDAEAVWAGDLVNGILPNTGAGVLVADLDTGIDASHPDLNANVLETWSVAGKADANNPSRDARDRNGHGTATAGVIAAVRGNSGVVGIAPDASIIAIQISKGSRLKLSDIVDGIELAILRKRDLEAQASTPGNDVTIPMVMNMSFGGGHSDAEEDALLLAANAGIVLVASAGNSSGGSVGFPAALDTVIAVSSAAIDDSLSSFSSVGSEVELIGSGSNIYTTYKDGTYVHISGTSFSAPQVAGVAALVLASGVSPALVRAVLTSTAENLGLSTDEQGSGLVDAEKAVLGTTGGDNLPGVTPPPTTTGSIAGTVTATDGGAGIDGASVSTDTGETTTTAEDGTYTLTDVPTGTRTVTASASGFGSASEQATVSEDQETSGVNIALLVSTTQVYHSSDISSVAPKQGPWYRLTATITLRTDDESLAPEGATVTGRIFRDERTFNYAQTVDANGQVSFGLRTQLAGTTYTVIVDSVNDGGGSSFDTARECASRTVTIGDSQGDCVPGASH